MQWYWGSTSGSTDAFPDVQWVSTQRTLPLLCIYLIFLWCFCWIALSACGLLFNIIEKGDPYGCMLVQTNYHFRLLPETSIMNYLRKALGVTMWSSLEMGERDLYWVRRVCRHGWQWKSSPELDPLPYTLKLCADNTMDLCYAYHDTKQHSLGVP